MSARGAWRSVPAAGLVVLLATPLVAQVQWIPPDEACKVPGNHFLLRGASLYLKQAAETGFPDERGRFYGEADRVLTEAIKQAGLVDNPATWYYMGRLYTARRDAFGADSAFRRALQLEPGCRDDVARWRKELAPHTLHAAALARQAQQTDSAVRLLRLFGRMDPDDPRGLIELVRIYLEREQVDSAEDALRAAYEIQTPDTAIQRHRRGAHLAVLRTYKQRVGMEPAVARHEAARRNLEAVGREVVGDSTVLAEMLADISRIRASGARLDPRSLQAFQAESTARSNRLGRARQLRDSLARAASADSTATEAVLRPAIAAYREFVDSNPQQIDAAADLAGLYAIRGETAEVNRVVERIVARVDDIAETELFLAGSSLLGAGQPEAAARLLAAGLRKNAYHRSGLYLLGRAHVARGAPDSGLAVAQQLREVDPLNDQPLRLVALAWNQLGRGDSASKYVALADSGLTRLVTVTQFLATAEGATLGGTVRNRGGTPLPGTEVTVEFLSVDGSVVARQAAVIPELASGAFHSFTVRGSGAQPIAAWRYRVP